MRGRVAPVGVDEKTSSINVKDGPPVGGGGMSISPPIHDMAPEAPKDAQLVDFRTQKARSLTFQDYMDFLRR